MSVTTVPAIIKRLKATPIIHYIVHIVHSKHLLGWCASAWLFMSCHQSNFLCWYPQPGPNTFWYCQSVKWPSFSEAHNSCYIWCKVFLFAIAPTPTMVLNILWFGRSLLTWFLCPFKFRTYFQDKALCTLVCFFFEENGKRFAVIFIRRRKK